MVLTKRDIILFNHFIEEIIIKDELLGTNALKLLGNIANYCVKNRTLNIPNTYLQNEQKILLRLISQEIIQREQNSIKFTHQILLDIVIVHDSINKNEDLLTFIISRAQFPFIRPIIRSYFFILYSMDFQSFQKQIFKTLSNIEVSYHIKRLLVESFAELEFNENNFKLLQKIYKQDKYLFERFFNVVKDFNWFEIIKSKFIRTLLDEDEKKKWTRLLLFKSEIFINTHTNDIVNYYNELTNHNIDKELLFPIFLSLTKLDNLNIKEIYNILEYSFQVDSDDHFFGEVLSKYIDQTNSGDKLLWQYIIKDINEDDFTKHNIKINCEDHNFHTDNFFQERLKKSEYLITKAFYAIEKWSPKIYGGFLDSCFSYEKRHRKSDIYGIGEASTLINKIEEAIIYHAAHKTNWWEEFEEKLLKSKELLFTYILIQIYEKDILSNIPSIQVILTNKEILDDGYIQDEILPLLNMSFPYLTNDIQDKIQSILLNINDDKEYIDEHEIYYKRDIYEYLLYIPEYLRTHEVQDFINKYINKFGMIRKSPSIDSWGGTVRSPITKVEFDSLSSEYIIKLFDHYNKPITGSDSEYTDRGYVGGKREICSTFNNVVLQNPKKYLYLIDILNSNKSYKQYFSSLLEAISNYIEHIDGNLSFGQNIEIDKTTDTFELANILLYQVEKNIKYLEKRTIVKALKACSYILKDEKSIVRIVFILYPLFAKQNIDIDPYENNDTIDTLNRISGIIGSTIIKLTNNYLDNNKSLPKILETLLIRLSKDGINNTKASILQSLPYLISKNKTLGWKLFDKIIKNAIPKILENTYNCLYYNYHKDFSKISKYLHLFYTNYLHIDECADIVGRIYGLAYIDKDISFDELFIKIKNSTNKKIIDGVISILTDNSNFKNYNKLCENTLIDFLENSELDADMVYKIETLFFNTDNFKSISHKLVKSIITNLSTKQNRYRDINALFEWLEFFAKNHDVISSLETSKELVSKIEELNFDNLYSSDKILSYLLILLEEADESDDEELVKEVLDIQERLYKLNIQTDKLYDEYT